MILGEWLVPGLIAAILPGLAAWWLTRRNGPLGLAMALAFCAVVAIGGWIITQNVLPLDQMARQAGIIFFVVTPALVSLVTGAVAGFWAAHRRR
ncbi:hypothetical protein [Paracoccus luteus]|uniref:hypothetical protein n=1 Tax=Paracoccus luteus TaxID=2508543 RepID=UPI0010703B8F|nr:hypothetical protein [Paracoccus luteus]